MYKKCLAAVIVGSDTDLSVVVKSGIGELYDYVLNDSFLWDLSVISAERHPEELDRYLTRMVNCGLLTVIGVAGMRPVLPVVIKSKVHDVRIAGDRAGMVWVAGVAMDEEGVDTILLNPRGSDIASFGIGAGGLFNAALASCEIIADMRKEFRERLVEFREKKKKKPMLHIDHCKLVDAEGRFVVPADWQKFPFPIQPDPTGGGE